MLRSNRARLAVVLAWVAVLLAGSSRAQAQFDWGDIWGDDTPPTVPTPPTPPTPGPQVAGPMQPTRPDQALEQLWDNLLHFLRVAEADTARSYAEAILAAGPPAREIYQLSVAYEDSLTTLARGARLEGLAAPIAQIQQMIEVGYQQERSDPQEIARSIEMLGGTLRQYELAVDRLQMSGEYALPQLIFRLGSAETDPRMRERIIAILPRLGREAVRGLTAALESSDPQLVGHLAVALARIEYPHAAPKLREALERTDLPAPTQQVIRNALAAVAGGDAIERNPAELFYQFGEGYYYNHQSMAADPREDHANVWHWVPDLGLVYQPVPREIFHNVYAMRYARQALLHDPTYYPAVSLWLAAMVQKEIDLPRGANDPTLGPDDPRAQYYVLASSPRYLQAVLTRALRDENGELAFRVIDGLAQTAGARSLVQPVEGGAQPLVQAMGYGDRRVRFLAALALAGALPQEAFAGQQLVLSVLNEALRQTGQARVLLIAPEQTSRNALQNILRERFELTIQPDVTTGLGAATEGAGIDVALLTSDADVRQFVQAVRQIPALSGLPVVVVGQSPALRALDQADRRVLLTTEPVDAADLMGTIGQALTVGTGRPLAAAEAGEWAIASARAIERLGRTNNQIFDLRLTERALADATASRDPGVQVAAADALAVIGTASAQQVIARMALGGPAEPVRIGAFHALAASMRKFGNMLTDQQTQQVVDVVTGRGSLPLRNAAAEALGAMDLASEKIKDLIVTAPVRR